MALLDRAKVLNWWTGRITDQELAEWTGMAPRAVALVLDIPYLRAGVSGGGRGSRHTRRINSQTRNAVAIVHALSEAGMMLETATNILAATPVIASTPTELVDWQEIGWGVRSPAMVDPKGGWLLTDVVPGHIWERFTLLCRDAAKPTSERADLYRVPVDEFAPGADGVMVVDRSAHGQPNIELKPIRMQPDYDGEIDPLGLYHPNNPRVGALPAVDEHLLIVNGRWVFMKSPDLHPTEAKHRILRGSPESDEPVTYDIRPVSVIEADKKTVRTIGWGRDEAEQDRAQHHLTNFGSVLDVNVTLAVRKMKRRAYGLPVDL